ncbi:MAG: hypothetical protein GEV13_00950 [Rhodospirillales bacterium]|nr:hypothetical protein [Rhodospirillales bacterium]
MLLWTAGAALVLAAAAASAQDTTPLAEVPFAGYGDAHVWPDCTSRVVDGVAWVGDCRLSGNLVGDGFTVSLDHVFRFGSAGCALVLPGARHEADIACRRLGQQFGSWIEVSQILGTPCQASGVLWSSVAASTEGERDPPVMHVVKVEVELLIEPGQAACEAGIWNETRYYLVCAERPDPGLSVASVNERVCRTGVEFLTFEAVHRKPDGTDEDNPWHRRLFAQVQS